MDSRKFSGTNNGQRTYIESSKVDEMKKWHKTAKSNKLYSIPGINSFQIYFFDPAKINTTHTNYTIPLYYKTIFDLAVDDSTPNYLWSSMTLPLNKSTLKSDRW